MATAERAYRAMFDTAKGIDDAARAGQALIGLGNAAWLDGRHDTALECWTRADEAGEATSTPQLRVLALERLAGAHYEREDADKAHEYASRALETAQALTPELAVALGPRLGRCAHVLADLARDEGDLETAREWLDRGVRFFEAAGETAGADDLRAEAGELRSMQGDPR